MPGKFAMLSAVLLVIFAGCSSAPPKPVPDGTFVPEPEMVIPTNTPSAIAGTNSPVAPLNPTVPAATPAPVVRTPTNKFDYSPAWISLERWCHGYGYPPPRRTTADGAILYSVLFTNGSMRVQIGSQLASWRGVDFRLGFPPQLIDGHPYVSSLDLRKNFLPLLEKPFLAPSNHLIVIDPGHGGTDTGTRNVYNGHFEKEFTLDLAKRLQARLTASGWNVLLTHTNDVDMKLRDRVAFAEEHKANLFISLHFNSAHPDPHETGLETYCLTPKGMPSTLTRGYRDDASLSFPNNEFDSENMQLAATLHRELLKMNGDLDRGVRRARFLGVLQGQNRPAVLIEGGYLSNPTEAKRIADPAYRDKMADAIAAGVQEELIKPVSASPVIQPTNPVRQTNAPQPATTTASPVRAAATNMAGTVR